MNYKADINFSINENSLLVSIIQNNKKVDRQLLLSDEDFNYYCNSILLKLQKGEL